MTDNDDSLGFSYLGLSYVEGSSTKEVDCTVASAAAAALMSQNWVMINSSVY